MKFTSLVKNQKGQGIMEYVIISSLIGICCLAMVSSFGKVINGKIKTMKEKVDREVTVNIK